MCETDDFIVIEVYLDALIVVDLIRMRCRHDAPSRREGQDAVEMRRCGDDEKDRSEEEVPEGKMDCEGATASGQRRVGNGEK